MLAEQQMHGPAARERESVAQNVLVDDDDLVRATWSWLARDSGIRLQIYATASSFKSEIARYNANTVFFLDYDLKDRTTDGIELARIVKSDLDAKVYLVTGHPAKMFDGYRTIGLLDGVYGKEFLENLMVRDNGAPSERN